MLPGCARLPLRTAAPHISAASPLISTSPSLSLTTNPSRALTQAQSSSSSCPPPLAPSPRQPSHSLPLLVRYPLPHAFGTMQPDHWKRDLDADSSSSDDSLFAAAAAAESSGRLFSPMFPLSALGPTSTQSTASRSLTPGTSAGGGASLFRQSSSLLSTSSSSEGGNELFGVQMARRAPAKPKTVKGTKTSFILGGKLGEGAYGTVKEAIDETTLRIVAVKVLDLRRLRKMRGSLDGIEREVMVQKRLKRHPNLIELVDVVRVSGKSRMYIVVEIANGCNVLELAERAEGGRLPEGQVANIAYQALRGLEYMHGKGVVHRDIKPANMMLTAGGVVKISDFGVAEFLNEYSNDDEVNRTSGSPAFQAPEIATGAKGYSGMKVDVWALGVTIYFLLVGTVPFEADNVLDLFDRIAKGVYEMPAFLSESCQSLIEGMLRVDWHERESVDNLLRHPWIVRGGMELTAQQRKEQGWLPIVPRQFTILDIVNSMYNNDSGTLDNIPGPGAEHSDKVAGQDGVARRLHPPSTETVAGTGDNGSTSYPSCSVT